MMARRTARFLALVILVAVGGVRADWWDDFTSGVHEKLVAGADFIRDKASPAIREKFNAAKETLQDPDTHEKVQDWVREEAAPFVADKFDKFKSFINEQVAPEAQKIYEAGVEAYKRHEQQERDRR